MSVREGEKGREGWEEVVGGGGGGEGWGGGVGNSRRRRRWGRDGMGENGSGGRMVGRGRNVGVRKTREQQYSKTVHTASQQVYTSLFSDVCLLLFMQPKEI